MANFNYNKIFLGGRLTADPERSEANGIEISKFSVAVTRKGKPKDGSDPATDFFRAVAFRERAKIINQYFHKGSSIFIDGQFQFHEYTDESGNKQRYSQVVVDDVYFVDSKAEAEKTAQNGSYDAPAQAVYKPQEQAHFEQLATDEDLPF